MSLRRDVPSAVMTTTHTAAAVLLAAAAVLGACSNDDETAPESTTTTVIPTNTTGPATTPPTTTSTSPSATTTLTATTTTTPTTQPPATTPPLTAPRSTTPPSDTIFTPEEIAEFEALDRALAEAVTRDWMTATQLFRQAQIDPTDAQALERALGYTTGGWEEHTRQFIARLREQNRRLLPEPLAEPTLVVEAGPTGVGLTGDEVLIVTCIADPWVLVEIGTNPEGGDTIVNDALFAYRTEVRLRLEEGIWKIVHTDLIDQWEGTTTCA
jgi:hypothetical protein